MKVKVINVSGNPLPKYETGGSVGMDLYANLESDFLLKPWDRGLVPCGIKIAIPEGYEVQVRPRSGLALREGLHVHLGTIDYDYRGEVGAIVYNLSNEVIKITPGQKIAQAVLKQVEFIEFEEVVELPETARGGNGFGSTGK